MYKEFFFTIDHKMKITRDEPMSYA